MFEEWRGREEGECVKRVLRIKSPYYDISPYRYEKYQSSSHPHTGFIFVIRHE
jgi:hypothetical protein